MTGFVAGVLFLFRHLSKRPKPAVQTCRSPTPAYLDLQRPSGRNGLADDYLHWHQTRLGSESSARQIFFWAGRRVSHPLTASGGSVCVHRESLFSLPQQAKLPRTSSVHVSMPSDGTTCQKFFYQRTISNWRERRDSNSQHSARQADELANCSTFPLSNAHPRILRTLG